MRLQACTIVPRNPDFFPSLISQYSTNICQGPKVLARTQRKRSGIEKLVNKVSNLVTNTKYLLGSEFKPHRNLQKAQMYKPLNIQPKV
jgi:hypothetical protein